MANDRLPATPQQQPTARQPIQPSPITRGAPSAAQSERRSMIVIFSLLLIAICLTVTGELLLKQGMDLVGVFSPSLDSVIRTFSQWRVLLGFALIFSGSIFWLGVISRADFSFAYPLLALSYVISLVPAHFWLGERVTLNRIIGALIIVVGVIVVTRR